MAKFIYIYSRVKSEWTVEKKLSLSLLANELSEEHCNFNDNEFICLSERLEEELSNFKFTGGKFTEEKDQYSFAFDASGGSIVLSSDLVGSRTIWYVIDEDKVYISSSQKLLVSILGEFQFNRKAASWMMANGTIGPFSWDERIKVLEPAMHLTIDKTSFECSRKARPIFEEKDGLETIFSEILATFSIKNAAITLSGGVDSQTMLWLLHDKVKLKAFNWGFGKLDTSTVYDSSVAKHTADRLKVRFEYYNVGTGMDEPHRMLRNFIHASEGRIDHLNSFCDHLSFWANIKEQGYTTVIRADEAFGWIPCSSEKDVRVSLDLNNVKDVDGLEKIYQRSTLNPPVIPDQYRRRSTETISSWRDRLYREYRIPYILSALHDPALKYVDIINPFLHDRVVSWAVRLQDEERDDKKKYREFSRKIADIRTSQIPSVPEPEEIVKFPQVLNEIIEVVNKQASRDLLGTELVDLLIRNVKYTKALNPVKNRVAQYVPFFIKKLLRNSVMPYTVDPHRLLFRAYIILMMHDLLSTSSLEK